MVSDDPDLDTVLDDAAFGWFSRDDPRSRIAARAGEHTGAVSIQTDTQLRQSTPANIAFDPLAKKHQKHQKHQNHQNHQNHQKHQKHQKHQQRETDGDLGDRLKGVHITPPIGAVDTNTGMKSTLEALGMPGARGTDRHGGGPGQSASSADSLEDEEGEDADDNDESSALVDMIMRQLLSKDVLYEPMKEIGAKYPEYLQSEGALLSEEEVSRYQAQQRYIGKICAVYESGEDRFDELMELLQGMQGCGNPPEAIMEELGAGAGGLGGLFGGGGEDGAGNGCPVS